jgi:hypothetical protein
LANLLRIGVGIVSFSLESERNKEQLILAAYMRRLPNRLVHRVCLMILQRMFKEVQKACKKFAKFARPANEEFEKFTQDWQKMKKL